MAKQEKQAWSAPVLVTYGNVEDITKTCTDPNAKCVTKNARGGDDFATNITTVT